VTGRDRSDAHLVLVGVEVMPGFAYGLRHPALIAELSVPVAPPPERLALVERALAEALPAGEGDAARPRPPSSLGERGPVVAAVLHGLSRLQRAARMPVFEPARILGANVKLASAVAAIPTPSRAHRATEEVLAWLTQVFDAGCAGRDLRADLAELGERLRLLEQTVPLRSNTPRFLAAAFASGIPYHELPGEVFQFGYGSRATLLDSTITEQTPQIAVRWARSKPLTSAVLRDAGIPVPAQRPARTVDEAARAARDLGYPVVVKPADLAGGVGVSTWLMTHAEVCDAFRVAQQESKRVLVEQHVEGRDYRLVVFQGEVVWAIERIPGGVTGDGASTVAALVERLNQDPRRGDDQHTPLYRLHLDDEAATFLARAGIGLDHVPGPGEFVRLRRAANIARGGMPVPVLDQVHPDNLLLAVRSAAALRFDLAGVDLLMPDIRRSWREGGAVVCEVNGQPQLGSTTAPHLYEQILRRLVRGTGRIPIAVVVGAPAEWNLAAAVAKRLKSAGFVVGRADHEGVSIGRATVTAGPLEPYAAGRLLAGERGVDAVVLAVADTGVLRTGLPFDRCDVLAFAGPVAPVLEVERGLAPEQLLLVVHRLLCPCCAGRTLVVAEADAEARAPFRALPVELSKAAVARSRAAEAIATALIEAGRRERGRAGGARRAHPGSGEP